MSQEKAETAEITVETTAPRIHFGEEIHPVKSNGYSTHRKVAGLTDRDLTNEDIEADAAAIADQDRNRKKKQASLLPILSMPCVALRAFQSLSQGALLVPLPITDFRGH